MTFLRKIRGNIMGADEREVQDVPRCQVYRTPNILCGNGATVEMTWPSLAFDTDGIYDAGSDDLTIRTTGLYRVDAHIYWDANAAGYRQLVLFRDATQIFTTVWAPNAVAGASSVISMPFEFHAGEQVILYGIQTSGGNLNAWGEVNAPGLARMSLTFQSTI